MHPTDRHLLIVQTITRLGSASVEALADTLATSRETIRRDLTVLDGRGLVRKVHGGARRADPARTPDEGRFAARMIDNVAEKRAIASRAAGLFRTGDALFMDAGSTTVFFAERVAELAGLTVITNSVAAMRFFEPSGAKVFLLGGEFDAEAQETLGPLAESQLRSFHAEHVVLTVGSVQAGAILDFDLREAELARAMIARARRVTVLADHSKFNRPALFEVAPLSRVDRLVTDRAPDPAMASALAQSGVEVLVAE